MKKPVYYIIAKDGYVFKYVVRASLEEDKVKFANTIYFNMNFTNSLFWAKHVQLPRLARKLRKEDRESKGQSSWSGVI